MIFNQIFTLLYYHSSISYLTVQIFPSCNFYWLKVNSSFSSNKGESVKFKWGGDRICTRREKQIDVSAVCFVSFENCCVCAPDLTLGGQKLSSCVEQNLCLPLGAAASHGRPQEPMKVPHAIYNGSHFTISERWNLWRRILMTIGR